MLCTNLLPFRAMSEARQEHRTAGATAHRRRPLAFKRELVRIVLSLHRPSSSRAIQSLMAAFTALWAQLCHRPSTPCTRSSITRGSNCRPEITRGSNYRPEIWSRSLRPVFDRSNVLCPHARLLREHRPEHVRNQLPRMSRAPCARRCGKPSIATLFPLRRHDLLRRSTRQASSREPRVSHELAAF